MQIVFMELWDTDFATTDTSIRWFRPVLSSVEVYASLLNPSRYSVQVSLISRRGRRGKFAQFVELVVAITNFTKHELVLPRYAKRLVVLTIMAKHLAARRFAGFSGGSEWEQEFILIMPGLV